MYPILSISYPKLVVACILLFVLSYSCSIGWPFVINVIFFYVYELLEYIFSSVCYLFSYFLPMVVHVVYLSLPLLCQNITDFNQHTDVGDRPRDLVRPLNDLLWSCHMQQPTCCVKKQKSSIKKCKSLFLWRVLVPAYAKTIAGHEGDVLNPSQGDDKYG